MKHTEILLALICVLVAGSEAGAQLVAFPRAEGAGQYAEGGRGGDVYHVTNLLDTGAAGTLRYGITSASGPRTIVFDVGGQINLGSELVVSSKSKLTIAGQTAPGDGITLAGNRFRIASSSDVVVRYMRVRVGGPAGTNLDATWIEDSDDVIVDHLSDSWATDETISSTHTSNNITVQWSIIGEPLGGTDGHAYGSLINGGDFTYHHNLYTQSRSRNPRIQNTGGDSTRVDFVNNVLYNPFDRFGYGDDDVSMNYVGNYAIAGPDTKASTEHLYVAGNYATKIYQSGNLMDLDKDSSFDGVDLGWAAFRDEYTAYATRFDLPMVTTQTATDALSSVLEGAGASLVRDAVDLRLVSDVLNHGGNIIPGGYDEDWVGGYPTLDSGTTPLDTDGDGMPDSYEDSISYLSPTNAADRNLDANGNGYTDLEDYLNWLIAPTPLSLTGDYNGDGTVDAADYTVWRDMEGQTGANLAADGDGNNIVNDGDYFVWRSHFGESAGSGSLAGGAAVPEPAGLALLLVGGVGAAAIRRRRQSRRRPLRGARPAG